MKELKFTITITLLLALFLPRPSYAVLNRPGKNRERKTSFFHTIPNKIKRYTRQLQNFVLDKAEAMTASEYLKVGLLIMLISAVVFFVVGSLFNAGGTFWTLLVYLMFGYTSAAMFIAGLILVFVWLIKIIIQAIRRSITVKPNGGESTS